MVYGSNALPSDAVYYQLTKASIVNGTLHINAGGSAKCTLSRAQLNSLSEYFRISLIPTTYADNYAPQIYVRIEVDTASTSYTYTVFPVQAANGVFTSEIKFDSPDYEQFTFEVTSDEDVVFTLWELCPESASDIEVIIDGVQQSLPKLLYDYNTTEITVGQSEQIVSMINCYLIANTDLQGHFLMNFTALERCTIHLRFFDSSMIELFSPLLYTVNAGDNTLEVPHAYLTKHIGLHNFYVTAQVTNGHLTVPIRGILYTIDGGYLAERRMDPSMDVCDISVRQLSSDNKPSEIWAIGVDNNNVIVKKRAYDLSKPNAAWDAVYTLGEGTLGAIEFDGDWVRRSGEVVYTLETYSVPTIAYTDTSGTLWVYQHGMDNNPIEMATNVSCISMVRGYKSTLFPDQDQGLILCWVRNGNAYYRQYAYFNGSYQWYPIEQLTDTGDVTFVQAHRLNDYRIGIVIQNATQNVWYITGRTYVSQAVPIEMINASLSGTAVFTSVELAKTTIECPTEAADASLTGRQKFITMAKEEEEALSFDAVHNAFDAVDAAQSDFYITFVYPKFIQLLNTTIDQWKRAMTVMVNSVKLNAEDYDLTIEEAALHIHLHTAVWGIVNISWSKVGILFFLDDTRYLINTQASYAYTWNIWKKISHDQSESAAVTVNGRVSFEPTYINKPRNTPTETLTATVNGTAAFSMPYIGDQPI